MTVAQPSRGARRSYRDPAGCLFFIEELPYRLVRDHALRDLQNFIASPMAKRWVERGSLVRTEPLSPEDFAQLRPSESAASSSQYAGAFRHEAIPFASFPHEWTSMQLYRAAELTLSLAEELLSEGRVLKDATPFNVLFRGTQPVFVDILSIEPWPEQQLVWLAYSQFVRTFLLPLLVARSSGMPLRSVFAWSRDGIEPEQAHRLLSPMQRLTPAALSLVTLPLAASRILAAAGTTDAVAHRAQRPTHLAPRIRASLFRGLRRHLRRVVPASTADTHWARYTAENHDRRYHSRKADIVAEFVRQNPVRTCLDLGCNTGELALAAARSGASVVAVDADDTAVSRLFAAASTACVDILPLVMDITAPSPAQGWRNVETPSFLDRARQRFDLVLAMALVHHLVIGSGLPLSEVLELLASVSRRWVLIEFVPGTDPFSQRVARGRPVAASQLTVGEFEQACAQRFLIRAQWDLQNGGRVAYLLELRAAAE